MLPHVKYDKFEVECRQKMKDMNSSVDVTSCPCWQLDWPLLPDQKNQICPWPLLHKHIREWEAKNTFRGVVVGSLSADPMRPSLRSATAQTEQMRLVGDTQIIESVYKRMKDVTMFLYNGLDAVYSPVDKKMLENIRTVLNLERLLGLTKEMSNAVVMQREVSKFLTAAESIDQDFDVKYEKDEFRLQYRVFVDNIAEIGKQKDSEKLTSMELVVMMMNTKEKMWRGCEAVMDIMCQAATMKSVESVVESWVSVLEHHSSKSRPLKAETIQGEMMVSVNGPIVSHSQGVVEETMKAYWGKLKGSLKNGHFTRRSERIKSYAVSKSIDALNNQVVQTPFVI